MQATSIRVPRTLRDRIQERAQAEGTTLAGAIERALDASDEQGFWESVRREHAALTKEERQAYLRSGGTDDLVDADDDTVSERGEW